ncbi:MAG: hypothetical protein KA902_06020 [Arenimonas sp.]|nr:hypothetical protein [Arenimonas sp.]
MLKKYLLLFILCVAIPCMAWASSASKAQKVLDASLTSYQLAIRWNDFEAAISSLDPEIKVEDDFSEHVEATFKEFQIVSYNVKSAAWPQTNVYQQRVAIEIIDINTQVVKTIIDKQTWRYDELAKRWWLTSGLPKLD